MEEKSRLVGQKKGKRKLFGSQKGTALLKGRMPRVKKRKRSGRCENTKFSVPEKEIKAALGENRNGDDEGFIKRTR